MKPTEYTVCPYFPFSGLFRFHFQLQTELTNMLINIPISKGQWFLFVCFYEKLNSNLPLWLGCWVSSVLCHSRFVLDCSLHSVWSCPRMSLPLCPCMSGLTPLSSDSAPFYCCKPQKKRARRKCEHESTNKMGIHWKWCTWKLYWPRKAVGGSDNPTRWHQWASTCMVASLLQANLPGPVLNQSICTPDNTVLRAHLSTVW